MESSNSKQRPMKQYLEWLEKQIDFCLEDKTMQREHWAFCKAYEKFKSLETTAESEELTPHIEYYSNGNVWIKGQKNSVGEREGLWEWFYSNGNIYRRTPCKEGKEHGIQIIYDEQGNITLTQLWKDGELIEETKPEPQPDPQLIDSMAMRYRHDFGFLDEKHKESIRTTMKQLWEEVVGLGFYKPK